MDQLVGLAQGNANLLGEVIAADAARSSRYEWMTAADVTAALSLERQRQALGCSDDVSCMGRSAAPSGLICCST